jgi:hypothetical protein
MRADYGDEALFWTDMTRQGCAGQYSKCGSNETAFDYKAFRIHATPFDGNCVAIYVSKGTQDFLFKTMQCKERLPVVCVGRVLTEESMATNIPEASHNDVTEFGYTDRNKIDNCTPDVIFL